jgi:hypothetical protein
LDRGREGGWGLGLGRAVLYGSAPLHYAVRTGTDGNEVQAAARSAPATPCWSPTATIRWSFGRIHAVQEAPDAFAADLGIPGKVLVRF